MAGSRAAYQRPSGAKRSLIVEAARLTARPTARVDKQHASSPKPDVDPVALQDLIVRVFGRTTPISAERTPDGVSCQVYRLSRGSERFYLRIAEERHENLAIDCQILSRLGGEGVRVPRVVHLEPFDQKLDRSVLVMSEVEGVSLAHVTFPEVARRVAREAGADAAKMNAIAVSGFGFLDRRTAAWPPEGELTSYAEFVKSYIGSLPERRDTLRALFSKAQVDALDALVASEQLRPLDQAQLAHGDLDVTQIYCHGGSYSGLIDFSELRGTEPEFDRGHFLLHDTETNLAPLFADFNAGYAEVSGSADDAQQIHRSSVLLGLRQLCRWLARSGWQARSDRTPRAFRVRAAQIAGLMQHVRS
jgi:aminoglycoside phosphotransferase (APT) family kinase protein